MSFPSATPEVPTPAAALTCTHTAKPVDPRCPWWQRAGTENEVLMKTVDTVSEAGSLPGKFLRPGADLELSAWSCIFDGEAMHATKHRGWRHVVGIVAPTGDDGTLVITWIQANMAMKQAIKAARYSHLLGGSGPNAALLRVARYVLEAPDTTERLARLRAMKALDT